MFLQRKENNGMNELRWSQEIAEKCCTCTPADYNLLTAGVETTVIFLKNNSICIHKPSQLFRALLQGRKEMS